MILNLIGTIVGIGAAGGISYYYLDTQQVKERAAVSKGVNAVEKAKVEAEALVTKLRNNEVEKEKLKIERANIIGYVSNPWFLGIIGVIGYTYVKKG